MSIEEMIEELEFCHINGQGSGQIRHIQAALRRLDRLEKIAADLRRYGDESEGEVAACNAYDKLMEEE